MRFWTLQVLAFFTGYYVALREHWAWSGHWAINAGGASDPVAVIVWGVVWAGLAWLVCRLD
jgi:hypothetical protein